MKIQKTLKNIALGAIVSTFVFACMLIKSEAKDLEITYNNDFSIESIDSIKIKSTHVIKNNSKDTVLRKENTDTFVVSHLKSKQASLAESVATVKITSEGKTLAHTVEYKADYALITVTYPRKVLNNDSLTLVMEYQNKGLIEHSGALFDIYIPGVPKDTVFEQDNQSLALNTYVYINEGLFPEQNFMLPKASTEETLNNGVKKYYFNRDSLLGKTLWIQRGKKQFYKFQITQKVEPTMQNDLGFKNEYALVLPRDVDNVELYQKVYFDQILPLPDWIEKDADGNMVGHFKISSTATSEIVVNGYVEVGVTGVKLNETNSGTTADYDLSKFKDSLGAAEYWEVDNPEIATAAKSILGAQTNIFKILGSTFSYVTDRINYSEVKRLGINDRQGALETLRDGSGVCMEYADLFLALARAEKIPTRAVFGYGFDPREGTEAQQTHQWVASYVPALEKWYDLDVTWGDSGQVAEGGNLNHFYTHIVSKGPNSLPDISVNIFGNKTDVALPEYKISALNVLPTDKVLLKQEDLVQKYPEVQRSEVIDSILQAPLKLSAYLSNVSNRDAISIVLLILGFCLIFIPIVLLIQKRIDLGAYNEKKDVIVP